MYRPTPITPKPPPDLPHMPDVGSTLSNYLRTFSLWASTNMATKHDVQGAAPGLLLFANDAPAGQTPLTFLVQVKSDGTLVTTPVATGGAKRFAG